MTPKTNHKRERLIAIRARPTIANTSCCCLPPAFNTRSSMPKAAPPPTTRIASSRPAPLHGSKRVRAGRHPVLLLTPPATPTATPPPSKRRQPPPSAAPEPTASPRLPPPDIWTTLLAPARMHPESINIAAVLTLRIWFPVSPSCSIPSAAAASPEIPPAFLTFCTDLVTRTNLSIHALFFSVLLLGRLAHAARQNPQRPAPGAEIRLLAIALLLADAAINDHPVPPHVWAEIMGVQGKEVARMKKEFLVGIGFDVSPGGYGSFVARVMMPMMREAACVGVVAVSG
ncbi:hypothetical protein BDK51DRAFT_49634 [Blyttiomyces helicus]|uniref:Cyclin N-terminal domain-containing protein n=1 Tax=Blyttiomyces helicus TaxID=388810 RepID=A0A4P9VZV3_9FUNG|nr:hypothetical protein BDK51DRAFT_49634 [Blyttiomyces helicus]|eukprot:RKO83820.1 hypothetical protein BDK51DRAFT_49634 [Blyttiomyces helicus]